MIRSDTLETDEARMLANILLEHHRYLRGHLWLTPDTVQPKHMLPYGELCTRAGLGYLPLGLDHFLGQVAYWCQSKGLPPLNALAVNAQTKMPGDGYYAVAGSHLNWWSNVQACIACGKYPQQV